MKKEEKIEALRELGLTVDQARTYLALVELGPATAKTISETSKIARPDIYRIMPTLQREGIVEKLMTKPAVFQAIPMTSALPAMLKRKELEQNKLRKKTEEMLIDIKNNHLTNSLEADAEFVIVPRKEAIMNRLKEALLKTQSSLCVITSQKRFSAAILEFEKIYQEALEKGVKIRLAADRHVPSKKALEIIQNLSVDPNFEVKCFEDDPLAIVSIFDDKTAYVTLSAKAYLAEAAALWSSNPSFVALAQNYFEDKWKNASYLNT